VDFEASLLGTIVIGRATGGLVKVRHCAYLYEWLDVGDWWGEVNALFYQIKAAIDTMRHAYPAHLDMLRRAMAINASWDDSAGQYVKMYRYGRLVKQWQANRRQLINSFIDSLGHDRALFSEFFIPARQEYSDPFDWELKAALSKP
jgi:hypothetical protein